MKPYFVRIKMIKGNLALYYAEPLNPDYKDFMIQASEMARPYLKEGWQLVHALMIDVYF